jgi:hypothetical protein
MTLTYDAVMTGHRAGHLVQHVRRQMSDGAAIGEFDLKSDRFISRPGCQGVFGQRNLVSGILGVPVDK